MATSLLFCAEASGAVCISGRRARSDVVTTTALATVNRIDVELRNALININNNNNSSNNSNNNNNISNNNSSCRPLN